jgi:hypothetical protein
MSEYVAAEYEGTGPVPGEPGSAGDGPAKDKAMQPAQAGGQLLQAAGQPLRQPPACERRR